MQEKSQMRLLCLVFFSFLYFRASSSPLTDRAMLSVSDFSKDHNLEVTEIQEHDSNGADNYNGQSSIAHSRKYAHGFGGHGFGGSAGGEHGASPGGGRSTGTGENGNDGSSTGGGAVIPVIVAGAASNHHPKTHHGAASRNTNNIGVPFLITTTLTSLIVHLYIAFRCLT